MSKIINDHLRQLIYADTYRLMPALFPEGTVKNGRYYFLSPFRNDKSIGSCVMNLAGKNIGQWNFIRNTNSETTSLKTEEPLVSGIYILQCQSDSKQFTQKILIRN